MAKRRNLPVKLPYGEVLIISISIGIIAFSFKDCPAAIRESYLKIIDNVIGDL